MPESREESPGEGRGASELTGAAARLLPGLIKTLQRAMKSGTAECCLQVPAPSGAACGLSRDDYQETAPDGELIIGREISVARSNHSECGSGPSGGPGTLGG